MLVRGIGGLLLTGQFVEWLEPHLKVGVVVVQRAAKRRRVIRAVHCQGRAVGPDDFLASIKNDHSFRNFGGNKLDLAQLTAQEIQNTELHSKTPCVCS